MGFSVLRAVRVLRREYGLCAFVRLFGWSCFAQFAWLGRA